MRILITGGAGFIGSALIRYLIGHTSHTVINIDKLTYAGNLESLINVKDNPRYSFERLDICDSVGLKNIFNKYKPDAVMHLAAESHVDRSIGKPDSFIQTNIIGTYNLLEIARSYWQALGKNNSFRFHHISTDEVYGDLSDTGNYFTETTAYTPSSPYSASKASADHLVRAWHRTYKLPTIITNCSNNYGPYHYPEKLIPLTILNALAGKPIPIYGKGQQIRDWLYVDDHVKALVLVIESGKTGETYNIGGHNEQKNIDVVLQICAILDKLAPQHPSNIKNYSDLITLVKDRPGHDLRYAIDASKIQKELNWAPEETFKTGLLKTVQWYIDNQKWCRNLSNCS